MEHGDCDSVVNQKQTSLLEVEDSLQSMSTADMNEALLNKDSFWPFTKKEEPKVQPTVVPSQKPNKDNTITGTNTQKQLVTVPDNKLLVASKRADILQLVPTMYGAINVGATVGIGLPYLSIGLAFDLELISIHVPARISIKMPSLPDNWKSIKHIASSLAPAYAVHIVPWIGSLRGQISFYVKLLWFTFRHPLFISNRSVCFAGASCFRTVHFQLCLSVCLIRLYAV